jgi:hypothetical protein
VGNRTGERGDPELPLPALEPNARVSSRAAASFVERQAASRVAALTTCWEFAAEAMLAERTGTLAELASLAKKDTSTLRAFAVVRKRITSDEWVRLIAWRDVHGCALDWWHIVYLAPKTPSQRQQCLAEMRSGIWRAVKIRQWGRAQKLGPSQLRPLACASASTHKRQAG